MAKAMFSNVCINWRKKEILTILNTDPKKPLGFVGLPGGKARNEETHEIGGPRELYQETNQEVQPTKHHVEIQKTGPDGDYIHYFIAVKIITERELKNHEEPLAIPQWVLFEEIISGRVKMFRSHIQGLTLLLEKMAEEKEITEKKVTKHGIPIISERAPRPVLEVLDELKSTFDARGHYVRKFVPRRYIRAGYRPFDN